MSSKIKIVILMLLLAITGLCVSCISLVQYFPTTCKFGIMREYQYVEGENEMIITFCRNSESGQLGIIDFFTTGKIVMKNEVEKDSKGEHVFVVDPEAAVFQIDDKKIQLKEKRRDSPDIDMYYSIVDSQRVQIFIDEIARDHVNQERTLWIMPSDFILNDGKRVIRDTIVLKQFEKPDYK